MRPRRLIGAPGRPLNFTVRRQMGLRKRLREDLSLEERRRGFARIVTVVLWLFAIGSTLAAVQVGRALWSGKVWVNFRGHVISAAEMWRELVFFLVVAIVCAPLAWYWSRFWRRRL
jgi:hypothetical protein